MTLSTLIPQLSTMLATGIFIFEFLIEGFGEIFGAAIVAGLTAALFYAATQVASTAARCILLLAALLVFLGGFSALGAERTKMPDVCLEGIGTPEIAPYSIWRPVSATYPLLRHQTWQGKAVQRLCNGSAFSTRSAETTPEGTSPGPSAINPQPSTRS